MLLRTLYSWSVSLLRCWVTAPRPTAELAGYVYWLNFLAALNWDPDRVFGFFAPEAPPNSFLVIILAYLAVSPWRLVELRFCCWCWLYFEAVECFAEEPAAEAPNLCCCVMRLCCFVGLWLWYEEFLCAEVSRR